MPLLFQFSSICHTMCHIAHSKTILIGFHGAFSMHVTYNISQIFSLTKAKNPSGKCNQLGETYSIKIALQHRWLSLGFCLEHISKPATSTVHLSAEREATVYNVHISFNAITLLSHLKILHFFSMKTCCFFPHQDEHSPTLCVFFRSVIFASITV